jgi:hypothetical protein
MLDLIDHFWRYGMPILEVRNMKGVHHEPFDPDNLADEMDSFSAHPYASVEGFLNAVG